MIITFEKNDEGTRQFAILISQLVKEGVVFEINNTKPVYEVRLTGGY